MFGFGKKLVLELVNADYAPEDLEPQLPIRITILRQLPGKDTPNYWLAQCQKPISWEGRTINYIVVGARFVGVTIKAGMGSTALNVAYVIDDSILKDKTMSLDKCKYIAICMANEVTP